MSKLVVICALLVCSIVNAGMISIRWDASPDKVWGYKVIYGRSHANYRRELWVGNVTTATLWIPAGTNYLNVVAVNNGFTSDPANELIVIAPVPPPRTNLTVISILEVSSNLVGWTSMTATTNIFPTTNGQLFMRVRNEVR